MTDWLGQYDAGGTPVLFPNLNDSMWYFAYGSNCNPAVMQRKRVRFRSRQAAVLAGYQLRFNKQSLKPGVPAGVGFANIQSEPGHIVEGVLYELVPEDLPRLDASERYPNHYGRILLQVECEMGTVACTVYQAQPAKIAESLKPTREYLDHLLAAGEFFSADYLAFLTATEIFPVSSP